MKKLIVSVHIILLVLALQVAGAAFAANDYFPNKIFYDRQDLHDFKCTWYIKQLSALEEQSIYKQSKNKDLIIFRFTWLRTFHNPIAIRMVINKDGTGVLFAKKTSGAGGYEPGKLDKSIMKPLNKTEIANFKKLLESEKFWDLPSTTNEQGLDGSHWIVEGLSNGKYHIVDRWSPEKGSVRTIGLYFLGISGIEIKAKEIY